MLSAFPENLKDLFVIDTQRTFYWTPLFVHNGLASFASVYDGDIIEGSRHQAWQELERNRTESKLMHLCTYVGFQMPCSLTFVGSIHRRRETFVCDVGVGCTGMTVVNAHLECDSNILASSSPFRIMGVGAVLHILNSMLSDCVSTEDGAIIQAHSAATVLISNSTFQHCFSKVLFLCFCKGFCLPRLACDLCPCHVTIFSLAGRVMAERLR